MNTSLNISVLLWRNIVFLVNFYIEQQTTPMRNGWSCSKSSSLSVFTCTVMDPTWWKCYSNLGDWWVFQFLICLIVLFKKNASVWVDLYDINEPDLHLMKGSISKLEKLSVYVDKWEPMDQFLLFINNILQVIISQNIRSSLTVILSVSSFCIGSNSSRICTDWKRPWIAAVAYSKRSGRHIRRLEVNSFKTKDKGNLKLCFRLPSGD